MKAEPITLYNTTYKSLFPYYGGKSHVAHIIWEAFGNVPNYIEPFFGSGAVLFLRPHLPHIETVNDKDGYISNFWRAVKLDPGGVAHHADWIISEVDLHARHDWLIGQHNNLNESLIKDPNWFDSRIAGWWLWGICQWIGGEWCKKPHRRKPSSGSGRGIFRIDTRGCGNRREYIEMLISGFSARLRDVRVLCGDWQRVCSMGDITKHRMTGVFFDPPYSEKANRNKYLYSTDDLSVANSVREWCIKNGDSSHYRIVLCGYEGEHEMPNGWSVFRWQTHGGYGNSSNSRGAVNKKRECLYLSPHCLYLKQQLDFLSVPLR